MIEQEQEQNLFLEEWWNMIWIKLFHYLHIKKYSGEVLLKNCYGLLKDRQMLNNYKIKIYIFGMEIVPNSIWIVLESTVKQVI